MNSVIMVMECRNKFFKKYLFTCYRAVDVLMSHSVAITIDSANCGNENKGKNKRTVLI